MSKRVVWMAAVFLMTGCASSPSATSQSDEAAEQSDEAAQNQQADAETVEQDDFPQWLSGCWQAPAELECWSLDQERQVMLGATFPSESSASEVANERFAIESRDGELVFIRRTAVGEPTVYEFVDREANSFTLQTEAGQGPAMISYNRTDGELSVVRKMSADADAPQRKRVAKAVAAMSKEQMTRMVNAIHSSEWTVSSSEGGDAKEAKHGITVYSKPDGHAIYIDGKDTGVVTAGTVAVEPGKYEVTVECSEGQSEAKVVALKPGGRVKLFIKCD